MFKQLKVKLFIKIVKKSLLESIESNDAKN